MLVMKKLSGQFVIFDKLAGNSTQNFSSEHKEKASGVHFNVLKLSKLPGSTTITRLNLANVVKALRALWSSMVTMN